MIHLLRAGSHSPALAGSPAGHVAGNPVQAGSVINLAQAVFPTGSSALKAVSKGASRVRPTHGLANHSLHWPAPTTTHMDLAARLRADARRANERRLLVLSGSPERTRDRAADALAAADIAPADTRYVGHSNPLAAPGLTPKQTDRLLGTTQAAVVLDCHDGCRPNALGAGVGAVDGGGLLLLLTPPLAEWPATRDDFDATLAVPPFDADDVSGHFRERLVSTLRAHRGIAIVDVDDATVEQDGLLERPPRRPRTRPEPPAETDFPRAAYDACLTTEQAEAVAALESLRQAGRAAILEANRGRGKSSAAGLAAAALALDGNDILVTAPNYRNAAELFARAAELLTDLGELAARDRAEDPRLVATETGRIRFLPPTDATDLPDDPDRVVVDEAAALPVRVLEQFLDAPGVVYATTVHGYEGAGRGFSVRFRDRLESSDREVTDIRLDEPIRYAPGDPVEVWAFRALALDARPAVDPLVAGVTPDTVEYRHLDPATLVADEHLLRETFGLLVTAHYRTEPNDLARLLDAPNVTVRALVHDDHVVSVALLAREGGLSADWRARMYEGERIPGNMIPDVLTAQLRDEEAARPVGYRVLRIATHHAVRSRGLGSYLLEQVRMEKTDDADWLGAGYGATPELLDFWTDNGFHAVHLSTTRNATSGEHSAIMVSPLSSAGEQLLARHTAWFRSRAPGVLAAPLAGVDPDVIRGTLRSLAAQPTPALSGWEWKVAAGIPAGTAIFGTAPDAVRKLAVAYLVATPADGAPTLTAREERLLVEKALQGRAWDAVADDLAYDAISTCRRAFGAAVDSLIARYGDEAVQTDRERLG